MIRIAGIRKRYQADHPYALAGLDLDIPRHCLFGLLGPNGAGKTTLIHALCGLIEIDAGRIEIEGHPVVPGRTRAFGHIGLAPQALAFYPTLTVAENLQFFARIGGLGEIDSAIAHSGLEAFVNRRAGQLSGGLKRRLNLAIALLGQPELLILDEPTVGIDAQSRGFILDTLRQLNAEGTTIIYTTHYLDEVQRLCQQIAIIDEGRLLASGTLADLIERDGDLETLFMRLTGTALRDQA